MGYSVGPSARLNMLVFAAYSPGLVRYVLKKPKSSAPPRRPKSGHGRTQALAGSASVPRGYEAREAHAAGRRPAPLRATS